MNTDIDIDALVAERVMGWTRSTRPGDYPWKLPNGKQSIITPDYSTDIAAAWQVVEKLAERGIALNIGPYWGHPPKHEGWHVELDIALDTLPDLDTIPIGDRYTVAPTAPLAICRAALKALTHTP